MVIPARLYLVWSATSSQFQSATLFGLSGPHHLLSLFFSFKSPFIFASPTLFLFLFFRFEVIHSSAHVFFRRHVPHLAHFYALLVQPAKSVDHLYQLHLASLLPKRFSRHFLPLLDSGETRIAVYRASSGLDLFDLCLSNSGREIP